MQGRDNTYIALGYEQKHPQINGDGVISLAYDQGPVCSEDPKRNISAVIKFLCKPGTLVCI